MKNLICSTSDDRTVRLWRVLNKQQSRNHDIEWETAEVSLQTTMFGHLARVWKAVIVKDFIVSIGEVSMFTFTIVIY